MALPPNLTTMIWSRKRCSHGSDSMSTRRLSHGLLVFSAVSWMPVISRVRAVLVDVVVREVVGEDRRLGVADVAGRSARASRGGVRSTSSRGRSGPPAWHTRTPFIADVDVVRVELGIRRADRREHAAPVGVVAEDRGLEEVVARDRATDLDGVVFGSPRSRPRCVMSWLAPSASPCSCSARSWHTLGERARRTRRRRGRRPRRR